MVLTKEQRIMYLERAREAKALKAKQAKEPKPEPIKEPSPEPEPVKVEKPKKIKKVGKSLDLTSLPDPKPAPKTEIVNEEVVEVITEVQKVKKPKRVVKKVIQQEYDSEDSEVEEVVVVEPPRLPTSSKPKKYTKKQDVPLVQIHDITSTLFNY